jgi:uncharacterized membrane protein YedE/YeeE
MPDSSQRVGGILFGFGMTLASGCGSKTLIRLGGASLKSPPRRTFVNHIAGGVLKGFGGVTALGGRG